MRCSSMPVLPPCIPHILYPSDLHFEPWSFVGGGLSDSVCFELYYQMVILSELNLHD